MLLRDLTLHLILFRFPLPVELRFIICNNYFPFLHNQKHRLTSPHFYFFVTNKDLDINVSDYIKDTRISRKYRFVLQITKSEDNLVVNIAVGQVMKSMYSTYVEPICRIINLYENNFYHLNIKCSDINMDNAYATHRFIIQWYRKRMLYIIDSKSLEIYMNRRLN